MAIQQAHRAALPPHILAALATVVDCARSHVQDIESGLEDGTYDRSENKDLPQKQAAIDMLEGFYRQQHDSAASAGPEIESAVAHAGELLIRAAAVLGTLSEEQRDELALRTSGGLPDSLVFALRGAAEVSPQVRQSLKTHPPAGLPGPVV